MTSHLRAADDNGRSVDLGLLYQRLAKRLEAEGFENSQVAAAVIAARGTAAMKPDELATAHGIVPADLAASEAGEIAWGQLPAGISTALNATPALNLDVMPDAGRA